jgi:RNA recognition motif-containing protein
MGSKLYVGNMSYDTTEGELMDLFSGAGSVTDAALMIDRDTGRSRGFAFVTMSSDDEAQEAIRRFNGFELGGRELTVNEARPKESGGGGGGGGGRRFGGGGGGGGRGDRGDRGGRRY